MDGNYIDGINRYSSNFIGSLKKSIKNNLKGSGYEL